jgi:hypothetical protein
MEDDDPVRRVVSDILLASLWKDILFRFGSESGSGLPVRGGMLTSLLNMTPGVIAAAGALPATSVTTAGVSML